MAKGKEKKEPIVLVSPEGRLVNGHLFVKNAFKAEKSEKEGEPQYRLEMSFSKDDKEFDKFIDDVVGHLRAEYGEDTFASVVEDGEDDLTEVRSPFIDGDALARKREKRGKTNNDGYKGCWVIRANTSYNFEGQDADGGIMVYDEKVKRILPVDKSKVYNGSYGVVKVELGFYEDNEGGPAAKFYLKAYQFTRDGERFASQQDHSSSFKPVGRAAPEEGGRRSRRG